MENLLREDERLDDLERSGLKIIQNPSKFCFGMDAVLLSGFVQAPAGSTVVDIGTGTGIIPILLSAKTRAARLYGLEIQPDIADMAARSVKLNHLEERVTIIEGDVKESDRFFKGGQADVITCNPPYMTDTHGLQNPDTALAIARHEIRCTLEDVVREGARMLKQGGHYYMVHRPHRLIDIISTMRKYRLEPKRMRLVQPYADSEANMVLIDAVKDGGTFLKCEPALIVYEAPGKYTREIYDIYGY